MSGITELTELDAEELHLVKAGANGFFPAMAKGLEDEMEKATACGCIACQCLTDATKAALSGKAINDLPDSAFAHIEPGGEKDEEGKTTPRSLRHFPVHDEPHARNALAQAPKSPFGDKAMPKIKAAAKKFGIDIAAKDIVIKDGGTLASVLNSNQNGPYPGSPAWEQQDAQTLIDAGQLIAQAGAKLQEALGREQTEVAVGQSSDMEDVLDLEDALSALDAVLGITARLAFTEEVEGGVGMSKAGRRLSGVSVSKIVTARDSAMKLHEHLTDLLGDDDPTKPVGTETTAKGVEMELTEEQLDERVTKAIADHDVAVAEAAKAEADRIAQEKTDRKATKATAKAAAKAKADEKAATKAAAAKCSNCGGTGKVDGAECPTCDGDGMSKSARKAAAKKAINTRAKAAAKAVRNEGKVTGLAKGLPDDLGILGTVIGSFEKRISDMERAPRTGGPLFADVNPNDPAIKALAELGDRQRIVKSDDDTPAAIKALDDQIEKATEAQDTVEIKRLNAAKAVEMLRLEEIGRGRESHRDVAQASPFTAR